MLRYEAVVLQDIQRSSRSVVPHHFQDTSIAGRVRLLCVFPLGITIKRVDQGKEAVTTARWHDEVTLATAYLDVHEIMIGFLRADTFV